MEQKKVNLSLLFSLIAFALGIAVKGFANYFGASFGIPFVAVVTMILLAMFFAFSNKENRKRLTDVIVLDVVVSVLWIIIFCAYDWAMDITTELVDFAQVLMNVISVLSLLFAGWTIFRLFCELAGKKVKLIEVVLGNEKVERKPKEKKQPKEKPVRNLKEVENGDLLDKPSRDAENVSAQEIDSTETFEEQAEVKEPTEEVSQTSEVAEQTENVEELSQEQPVEEPAGDTVENVEPVENVEQTENTEQQVDTNSAQNGNNPFNSDNFDRYIS